MMGYFGTVANKINQFVLRMRARNTISRLRHGSDGSHRWLADALGSTLANQVTSDEKVWIDSIESLRAELRASTTEVSRVDYGDLNLTDDQMYQDRYITRTIGDICETASKSYFWSLLLFKLVREFKPSTCLELGTCLGISASFQAAALKLNQTGKIVTLEGAESLASVAQRNFQSLGLDNVSIVIGRFQDTLEEALHEYGTMDYVFIDGHHDEKATINYFEQIVPFLADRAVLVFDDISWTEGMKRAWSRIERDESVKISVDLSRVGICVIDPDVEEKQNLTIPIYWTPKNWTTGY